ncbi:MAG: hypothetical protein IPK70_09720 [Flavobacteriales bacterium]|jgi:hypothetical protein|nr:hypothetical protein [Flavobacteriales bacterium]
MKARNWILIGGIALAAAGAYGLMEFNRGHDDLASSKPDHTLDAPALLAAFVNDEAVANAQYVEKVLQVKGTISSIETGAGDAPVNLMLDSGDPMAGILCEFNEADLPKNWEEGAPVTVKGICAGYLGSDLLPGNVILQRCVAVE